MIEKTNNFQKSRKMKRNLKETGITLIALVVTIIILLILAGVTLNMALSDNGLIKRSQETTEKYKQAQEDEEKALSQAEILLYSEGDYVGKYVTGYNPEEVTKAEPFTIKTQTSGMDSDQQFTTDTDMQWRIWDYDGETLRLISDRPTKNTLALTNVAGYNNGVWAMNEICRQCYTDNSIAGIEVRNLRRSDIEAVSNYDYTTYKHLPNSWYEPKDNENEEDLLYYGQTKKYDTSFRAPKMWVDHDKTWTYEYNNSTKEKSCIDPWEQEFGDGKETGEGSTTKDTEFKQSWYAHSYNNEEFENSQYYDLIFKREDTSRSNVYWLAGRYVHLFKDNCDFGLHLVKQPDGGGSVEGNNVFYSSRNYEYSKSSSSSFYFY